MFAIEKALAHFIGALHLNHAGDLADGIDIGTLQKPLVDVPLFDRLNLAIGAEHDAILADHGKAVDGAHETDLGQGATVIAQRAVGREADIRGVGNTGAPPASSTRNPSGVTRSP